MAKHKSTESPPDFSQRAAYTVDEFCGRVMPISRAAGYQDMATGLLLYFQRGGRRYIPISEREEYPKRLAARAGAGRAA